MSDWCLPSSSETLAMFMRRELLDQKERILFGQLNNLVRDGVLLIEETEPVLIQDTDPITGSSTLRLKQAVRLTFRAEEVLENYRKKVE